MIVFDLECRPSGHRFEGWFGSSDDYASQQERGLVTCPSCGVANVVKAPMAPNLGVKGKQLIAVPTPQAPAPSQASSKAMSKGAIPPEAIKMMQALAEMQSKALEKSRWVGDSFAETSREMHYGEREAEPIHGQATMQQAKELIEEGIEVAPLPFPVITPGKAN
jgi:hypothetical protein